MSCSSGRGDGLETAIDVEFSSSVGAHRAEAPDAPALWRTSAHEIDDDPTGDPTCMFAELLVGGADEFGEQGECLVGVIAQCVGERVLIEYADLG